MGMYHKDGTPRFPKLSGRRYSSEGLAPSAKLLHLKVMLTRLCDTTDKEYADEDGFVTYGLVSTKRIRDILEKF